MRVIRKNKNSQREREKERERVLRVLCGKTTSNLYKIKWVEEESKYKKRKEV